jgi:hypothetical protein
MTFKYYTSCNVYCFPAAIKNVYVLTDMRGGGRPDYS